jgi:hypothetical protein
MRVPPPGAMLGAMTTEPQRATKVVARVYIEPWPAGGWVVRLADHPLPVSRHDTQHEAEFRAAAYRRAIARGERLALGSSAR